MPAIVDHDARRASLAETAANLIATEGLDAATVRRLAKAAGYSTKVVSHYFADKRALLLATYRFGSDHSAAGAARARRGVTADARAHVIALLPNNPDMVRNWKIWFAFWGHAIVDEGFAREQRRQVMRARVNIMDALARDPAFAHLDAETAARLTQDVLTLVTGVALQAAFDPADWPPERQAQAILERMDALAAS